LVTVAEKVFVIENIDPFEDVNTKDESSVMFGAMMSFSENYD
jgi:hypothetical protein